MRKNQRDQYFGQGRVENVETLPFNWHAELTLGGTNLFVYFFPDTNYPAQITGLFKLQNVTLSTNLSQTLTQANLGTPIIAGAGTLGAGELVVNGVDLAGTYATAVQLMTYINTGIISGVTASIIGTEFVLTAASQSSITISTLGTASPVNSVTFYNFSTLHGLYSYTYVSQGLDQFYINYLQYRLADRLCTAYNFVVPEGVRKELLRYMQLISKRSSPIDMSVTTLSTLTSQMGINYAQVNLGKGWTINA